MGETPGDRDRLDERGGGLACPVRLADRHRRRADRDGVPPAGRRPPACSSAVDFTALMPAEIWTESSAGGLRTVVGRDGPGLVRTGAGRRDPALAGRRAHRRRQDRLPPRRAVRPGLPLFARTSWSCTCSTSRRGSRSPSSPRPRSTGRGSRTPAPSASSPTANTASPCCATLAREMSRRATELKRAGVTRLVDLRAGRARRGHAAASSR